MLDSVGVAMAAAGQRRPRQWIGMLDAVVCPLHGLLAVLDGCSNHLATGVLGGDILVVER